MTTNHMYSNQDHEFEFYDYTFNLTFKIILMFFSFLEAPKRCEDMGQSCGLLQQRGFCSVNFFRNYMQANCAATCGFCRGKNKVSESQHLGLYSTF